MSLWCALCRIQITHRLLTHWRLAHPYEYQEVLNQLNGGTH